MARTNRASATKRAATPISVIHINSTKVFMSASWRRTDDASRTMRACRGMLLDCGDRLRCAHRRIERARHQMVRSREQRNLNRVVRDLLTADPDGRDTF